MNIEERTSADNAYMRLDKIRVLVISCGHVGVNWQLSDHPDNSDHMQSILVHSVIPANYMVNLDTDEIVLI
jgi:hypothetical protein